MENIYIKTSELSNWFAEKHFKDKDLISVLDLICLAENLDSDYEKRTEEYEDLIEDVRDNYKFIGMKEAVGYDETW